MRTGHLINAYIVEMAEAALATFEWTGSWHKAAEAARQLAADEFCIRATHLQVEQAIQHAQTRWQEDEFGEVT